MHNYRLKEKHRKPEEKGEPGRIKNRKAFELNSGITLKTTSCILCQKLFERFQVFPQKFREKTIDNNSRFIGNKDKEM